MVEHLDMEIICDDDVLKCWFYEGTSARLVLAFSGIGTDSESIQLPEFIQSSRGMDDNSVLHFADVQRSWLNNLNIIERIADIVEQTKKTVKVKTVSAIGHSMGGYCAVVMSHFIDIQSVFATSLQMSIDPKFAPREGRWMNYRSKIASFRIHNAADYMKDTTTYFLVTGDHKREFGQRNLIPRKRNIFTYILPNVAHESQNRLKRHKILYDVIQAAIQNKPRRFRQIMERTNAKLFNGRRVIEGVRQRKLNNEKK